MSDVSTTKTLAVYTYQLRRVGDCLIVGDFLLMSHPLDVVRDFNIDSHGDVWVKGVLGVFGVFGVIVVGDFA